MWQPVFFRTFVSFMFDFIHIGLSDILDIVVVSILLYQVYKLIRGTAAINIFTGVLLLYFIWFIVQALHMQLLARIMGQVLGVGIIALIILFQQEIRRFLLHLGNRFNSRRFKWLRRWFKRNTQAALDLDIDSLVQACKDMSDTKTGALIVLERRSSLEMFAETGDIIDAKISKRLIENIFFKNSPLHDGAMIITRNKIHAARCTLPITDKVLPAHYGMRHRASVGLTEGSDSVVITVSEETGRISVVENGEITPMSGVQELRLKLEELMRY